jgi:hypothetical protein
MPPVLAWTFWTVGAALVSRFVVKEWRRVNAELDRVKKAAVDPECSSVPHLRRDPQTGVYRP